MLNLFQHEKHRKTLYPLRKTIFLCCSFYIFTASPNLLNQFLIFFMLRFIKCLSKYLYFHPGQNYIFAWCVDMYQAFSMPCHSSSTVYWPLKSLTRAFLLNIVPYKSSASLSMFSYFFKKQHYTIQSTDQKDNIFVGIKN